jgi:hypothetical protein
MNSPVPCASFWAEVPAISSSDRVSSGLPPVTWRYDVVAEAVNHLRKDVALARIGNTPPRHLPLNTDHGPVSYSRQVSASRDILSHSSDILLHIPSQLPYCTPRLCDDIPPRGLDTLEPWRPGGHFLYLLDDSILRKQAPSTSMVPILECEHLRGLTGSPADGDIVGHIMLSGTAAQGSVSLDLDDSLPWRSTPERGPPGRLLKPPCRRSLGAGTVMEESAKLNQLVNGRNA